MHFEIEFKTPAPPTHAPTRVGHSPLWDDDDFFFEKIGKRMRTDWRVACKSLRWVVYKI